MIFLHFLFNTLLLSFSIFFFLSKHPLFSILSLILIFFISSFISILFGVDFLGLLIIIIYVGAIAVLFLFVIMMLDLKIKYSVFNANVLLLFLLLSILISFVINFLSFFFTKKISVMLLIENNIDYFSNIDIFGQYLYSFFSIYFIISGIILLLALIGSVVLTLKFNNYNKTEQKSYNQLSRRDTFISFFK